MSPQLALEMVVGFARGLDDVGVATLDDLEHRGVHQAPAVVRHDLQVGQPPAQQRSLAGGELLESGVHSAMLEATAVTGGDLIDSHL